MEIFTKKQGHIKLSKQSFVAAGGEAEIYAQSGTAYKIYTRASQMLPLAKIQELGNITDASVIKPIDIIYDNQKSPVGYSMRYISDTYSLCQLFTKAFRDRNHLSNENMFKLIKQMQNTIKHIHSKNILIVDLNEMNFLVEKNFKEVYFIDVDSYQTPSFPATAIMESIRDRHNNTFSENTDWFSFGIVSFQMFIGIHPFKGKHATLKTLDERMLNNMPVFHKDVSYPAVCQPFDVIPQAYKDWYKAIFTSAKRVPPPAEGQAVIVVTPVRVIEGNMNFDIIKFYTYNEDVVDFISIGGVEATTTTKGIYKREMMLLNSDKDIYLAITPNNNDLIYSYIDSGKVKLFRVKDNVEISCDIAAEQIMSYDGRLFIKNLDILSEINFMELSQSIKVVPNQLSGVMTNATKLYDGVAIQNMLGTYIAEISPKKDYCYQITLHELKGYQIIDAKYDNQVLMIIGSKKGKYDKFVFKLNSKFLSYSLRKDENITYQGLNFIVLDNGIAVHINESEDLEIFNNKETSNDIKVIKNHIISSDMRLFKDGTHVMFAQGKSVYRIKMK